MGGVKWAVSEKTVVCTTRHVGRTFGVQIIKKAHPWGPMQSSGCSFYTKGCENTVLTADNVFHSNKLLHLKGITSTCTLVDKQRFQSFRQIKIEFGLEDGDLYRLFQ